MENIVQTEGHWLLVKLKANTNNKAKIYYGWIDNRDDISGKEIIVCDTTKNSKWSHAYYWNASIYIDREDCDVLKILQKVNWYTDLQLSTDRNSWLKK